MLSRSTCAWSSGVSIGLAAMLPSAIGAEQADQQRPGHRRSDRGGEILRGAAQRADVAGEFFRRRGDQHIEQQRDQRALPDAEQDEAEQDRDSLQSLRTTKASHTSATVQRIKP